MEHLFISCPFEKLVSRIVYSTYNIPPPTNITSMFSNWLNGIDKRTKARICIGVVALCWSIWNRRNNLVLNRSQNFQVFQVINMADHWIQLWSLPPDQRELMAIGCTGSWRSLRIFSTGLHGSILVDLGMPSCFMLSFFLWLIDVSTLSDP